MDAADGILGRGARRSRRRRRRRSVGVPHSSPTTRSGSPAARGALGGVEDLAREVAAGRAVQPRRAGDPERAPGGSPKAAARRPPRRPSFDAPYGLAGDRSGRPAGSPRPSVASAVEDLVRRDRRAGRCRARRRRAREHAGRLAVAAHGELRVAGTAVDVGPGRGMDDDLGAVAVQERVDAVGRVEVELARGSRRSARRAGERRIAEGGDEGPARGGRSRR